MNNPKFTPVTDEALLKNEKKAKALILVFAVTLAILFITTALLTIKKGFTPLIATPVALLPILILLFKNRNDLKKEIKARNLHTQ